MNKPVSIALLALVTFTVPALSSFAQTSKSFTTLKELPITSVKNQYRSGTCWDYATLGYFESEILRKTGKTYDLCEMFVVNKDYMDCATHYVRMHGYSQISEGGSCDDVADVIRRHGICPEEAMPLPGSLVGEPYANFKVFFPELEKTVIAVIWNEGKPELNRFTTEEQAPLRNKRPAENWQEGVQAVIDKYVGKCPETFDYEGKTYTPKSFAEQLGLNMDDYVSLTSYTHHPFDEWFILEAPYKWRLKPSYNIPIDQLMAALDRAIDNGYTVAWGGDVSGSNFVRKDCIAQLPEGVVPSQEKELLGGERPLQGHLVHVPRLHGPEHHLHLPEPRSVGRETQKTDLPVTHAHRSRCRCHDPPRQEWSPRHRNH